MLLFATNSLDESSTFGLSHSLIFFEIKEKVSPTFLEANDTIYLAKAFKNIFYAKSKQRTA
jgi:hypothetical protein